MTTSKCLITAALAATAASAVVVKHHKHHKHHDEVISTVADANTAQVITEHKKTHRHKHHKEISLFQPTPEDLPEEESVVDPGMGEKNRLWIRGWVG